jgi:Zn-finger nucleic acid-binding protein
MMARRIVWVGVLLTILLAISVGNAATRRHGKNKSGKGSASKTKDAEESKEPALRDNEVLLKLTDGSSMRLGEARETAQGIWYQRGGITYLVARDRIKSVERGSTAKASVVADVLPDQAKTKTVQPVWIYLVGGARVEVDSANESSAGVWYRRGPLNIFIERSRVERIEREDLESIAKSDSSTKGRGWTTGNAKIDSLIKQNGAKHGVDPYLIFCVMEQESHFSSHAVSPKGARGLMQLMPGTGARFGVRNPFSPAENIAGGTRYLKQLMNQFNGRVELVLASYNAGEGAVVKFGHKVPPYRETRDYVRRISYRYHGPKKPEANHKQPASVSSVGR